MSKKILPLAIIGAGPAGLTAAIYAKRSNIQPIIFTNEIIGGKANKTLLIENYPAFKSTTGAKLCKEFAEQIKYLKISVIYEKILSIKKKIKGYFELKTSEKVFVFEKVIIATGTKEKKLPAEGISDFEGLGISYCSSCDGYFFKGLKIAVVGGGNAAVEETKILAQIASQVIILCKENKLDAEPMLIEEINLLPNVFVHYNVVVKKAFGKEKLEGVYIENIKNHKQKKLLLDGLFVYIGSVPNTNFIDPQWKILDKNSSYIVVNEHFATKIPNLYAIGDVVHDHIQQYTTAMSSATVALQDIVKTGFISIIKK